MSFLNPEIPSPLELNPLVSVDNSLSVNLGKNLIETESRSRSTALWSISSTLALEPLTASSLYLNQQVLPLVKQALQQFVLTDNFDSQIRIAFGEDSNVDAAYDLVENLAGGEFPFNVQTLSQSQLQGDGAFGKNTLFVSEDLLNSHRLGRSVDVILEEMGHFIDSQINSFDAPGDEGEIFADLVQQRSLSEIQLITLKTEDDHSFLSFNNELIAVEKALPPAGVFQVDSTGKLQIDFLADSGAYRSEMAVFSLEGMDSLQRGSAEFIKEAARRALTSSVLGYTVIIDPQEGAKFSGELGEKNLNDGSYGGAKIFSFNAGDQVAMMLVPQGTVQEIFNSPLGVLPLFSLAAANPQSVNQLGQLVPGTFGWEDIRADQNTDADYNDIVFQVKGALGNLPDLGTLIAPGKDWRDLTLAKQITQFASQSVPNLQVNLTSDTGQSNSDRVTNNPEIVGSITNQAGNIEQLQASLNGGNFVNLVAQYQADASFRLTQTTLAEINGGNLADGNYQLVLKATDQFGNNSEDVSFSFTLDTTTPQTPNFILNTLFDSAPIGDSHTTYSQINLLGQTEANALLTLTGLGLTTTADSSGKFNFTNIALALGTNNLTVSSQDLAGNSSTFTVTIQRDATGNSDVVLDWNATLLNAVYQDKTAPPLASRNMAMVQAAVFDTVNSFNNTYKNYHFVGSAPVNASIEAAAASAAYRVLVNLYPKQKTFFDNALTTSLAEIPDGTAEDAGVAFGQTVANDILSLRNNDGSANTVIYTPGINPGEWQPTPPAFNPALLPQWGEVTPFALTSGSQFRPDGPPALDSAVYTTDFNQVKELGSLNSTTRTAEQTEIAKFWANGAGTFTPPGHWNQIAQNVAVQKGNSLLDNARLFALLDISLADAGIAAWDAKYQDNFWRPITAIQKADTDGNANTIADTNWQPLLTTPAFPEYVSGHSTFSGAAATILTSLLGDNVGFTINSLGTPGIERQFTSFTAAAEEAGMSRIYGGIHFNSANVDGLATGRKIGNYVLQNLLTKDVQAPVIQASLSNDTGSNTDKITNNPAISGTVTDENAIAVFRAKLDSGAFVDVSGTLQNGAFSLDSAKLKEINGNTDLAQGEHTLGLEATDSKGNVSAVLNYSFTLDSVSPIAAITSNLSNEPTSLDVTVSEVVSGEFLAQGSYSLKVVGGANDGQSVVINSLTKVSDTVVRLSLATPLTAGNYQLAIAPEVKDTAGNSLANQTLDFTATPPTDVQAPVVQASLTNDTGSSNTDKITNNPAISGTVTDENAIAVFRAKLDSGAFVDVSGTLQNGAFSLDSAKLKEINGNTDLGQGEHTLGLEATDSKGNVSAVLNYSFTLDSQLPTITTTEVLDDGVFYDQLPLKGNAEGTGSAIAALSYQLDSGVVTPLTVAETGAFDQALDVTGLTNGLHTLTLTTQDLAGNSTTRVINIEKRVLETLSVMPGDRLAINLTERIPNSQNATFSLASDIPMPNGMLEGNGILVINPSTDEIGTYNFSVTANTDTGNTTQDFRLEVVADPITTTRISGVIANTSEQPLAGVVIELGSLQTLTDATGKFTLEIPGDLPSDTLKIRGEGITGNLTYPFIAEKLPLLLGRDPLTGVNNVIARPIYLPPIDMGNAVTIDPNADTTVTTDNIPGASVFVAAGTIQNPAGEAYTGQLSITTVPTELTPAALPGNLIPDLVVTIQPGEMRFNTPAPLSLPNLAGYAPGTIMDLWSINPQTGLFDNVGKGQVSDDGTVINTIEGGIRNSSWHFFAPPSPTSNDPNADGRNPEVACACDYCPGSKNKKASVPGNSEVELHSGAVIETHDLVAYQSLGINRGISLTYDSERADARPILHFGYNNVVADPNLRLVGELTIRRGDFQYQVPGFAGGQYGLNGGEHLWSIPQGGKIDAALQADMRSLNSGRYDYELTTGLLRLNNDTFTGSTSNRTGKFLHVNSIGSIFGDGWGLSGLEEIVENSDGSILLINGDGSELLFEALAGGGYDSPRSDFSTLEKLEDGTFRRTLKDQTVYLFNAQNQLATVRDRVGNETRYLYDARGNLSQMIDPVGLVTNFVYTGNRVTKIIDPAGRITQLTYDRVGNLISITDPDNSQRTWEYDAEHHMTAETDKRGNHEQMFYDFAGRADRAIRKDGSTLDFDPVQVQGLYPVSQTTDPLNAPAAFQLGAVESVYVDANGNKVTTLLDKAGQKVSASDEVGVLPSVGRNQENLVTSSTDGRGKVTSFTYDAKGNVLTIQDSLSFNTPNAGGNVLIVNGASGSSESGTTSDSTNNIKTLLQEAGFQTTVVDTLPIDLTGFSEIWDIRFSNSQPITTTESTQYLSFLQSGGELFAIGENGGFSTRNNSLLSFINQAGGGTLNFTIPNSTQQISDTFTTPNTIPDGNVTYPNPGGVAGSGNGQFITFDGSGNSTAVIFNEGDLTNALTGKLVAVFDINFFQGTYDQPDSQSLLKNIVQSNPTPRRFTYDPKFNKLTSMTDELGHQTLYEIDANNGNVLSTTQVVGEVGGDDDLISRFTYTVNGLLDTATDPLGRITDNDYDTFGRLITITYAKGTTDEAARRFEYDQAGNQTVVIDENGNITHFEYDSLDRLTKVIEADPDGAGPLTAPITTYTYDGDGNLVSTTDALGRVNTNQYDNLNRLIKNTDPLSQITNYNYDAIGNLLSVIDPLGHKTENVYDDRDRLIKTIDPDGGISQFSYDLDNNLISVIDPVNNQTTFAYDARSRLVRETDPLGKATQYQYDAVNNLITKIDRNDRRTDFTYDDLNRVLKEAWVGTDQAINYSYDKASNLTAVTDKYSALAYSYDNRDRHLSENNTGTPNSPSVVLNYRYDAAGNLLSMGDTINGVTGGTNAYSYDALNRLSQLTQSGNNISDKRVNFAYNVLGQYTSVDRYSDLTGTQLVNRTNYSYDNLNRLTSLGHSNGTDNVAFYNYLYDSASRITQITDVDGVTDYTYDNRSQLTGANHSDTNNPDESYAYDANGNRTNSSVHGDSYQTGAGNRLTSDGTYNYEYDNEGNLSKQTEIATGKVQELTWDYRNRLVAILDKDGAGNETQRVEFTYDAFNRRIAKAVDTNPQDTTAAIVTQFVYDGEDVLLEFVDSDGVAGANQPVLTQRYLHGEDVDQVLAQESAGGVVWQLTDHLGTVRDLVNNNGAVVNHFVYDSYGQVIAETNPAVDTRYLFTGREFDQEIGLYYYRARYYNQSTARFLSEDPIGFAGRDKNLYRYVANNSVNLFDPLGLTAANSQKTTNQRIMESVIKNREFSTENGPDGGRRACAYAVNKIMTDAGLPKIGGNPNLVESVEDDLKAGKGKLINKQSEAEPGDLAIAPGQHIGICMNKGCTQIRSNSSSKAKFKWNSNGNFGGTYGKNKPNIYRVK